MNIRLLFALSIMSASWGREITIDLEGPDGDKTSFLCPLAEDGTAISRRSLIPLFPPRIRRTMYLYLLFFKNEHGRLVQLSDSLPVQSDTVKLKLIRREDARDIFVELNGLAGNFSTMDFTLERFSDYALKSMLKGDPFPLLDQMHQIGRSPWKDIRLIYGEQDALRVHEGKYVFSEPALKRIQETDRLELTIVMTPTHKNTDLYNQYLQHPLHKGHRRCKITFTGFFNHVAYFDQVGLEGTRFIYRLLLRIEQETSKKPKFFHIPQFDGKDAFIRTTEDSTTYSLSDSFKSALIKEGEAVLTVTELASKEVSTNSFKMHWLYDSPSIWQHVPVQDYTFIQEDSVEELFRHTPPVLLEDVYRFVTHEGIKALFENFALARGQQLTLNDVKQGLAKGSLTISVFHSRHSLSLQYNFGEVTKLQRLHAFYLLILFAEFYSESFNKACADFDKNNSPDKEKNKMADTIFDRYPRNEEEPIFPNTNFSVTGRRPFQVIKISTQLPVYDESHAEPQRLVMQVYVQSCPSLVRAKFLKGLENRMLSAPSLI